MSRPCYSIICFWNPWRRSKKNENWGTFWINQFSIFSIFIPMKIRHKLWNSMNGTQFLWLPWFLAKNNTWLIICKTVDFLISRFFIFRSGPGFQIWVSNLRFTSYFSFNLFLSNYWLLVFGFLQSSAIKPRFWTFFFSANYYFFAQQPRIRVFKPGFQNPGFQFPVSNKNW